MGKTILPVYNLKWTAEPEGINRLHYHQTGVTGWLFKRAVYAHLVEAVLEVEALQQKALHLLMGHSKRQKVLAHPSQLHNMQDLPRTIGKWSDTM